MFRTLCVSIITFFAGFCALGQDPAAADIIAAGPMPGYATETEVAIWVQTTRSVEVRVGYWPQGQRDRRRESSSRRTEAATSFCTHFRISNLPHGTRFDYEVLVDKKVVPLPRRLEFQTQAHWRQRTDPPDVRVLIASCAHVNDPVADRPGTPYGGDKGILGKMAGRGGDLMIWMGDNVYFREPDWTSESGMRRRYSYNRRTPALQALLGATHHYAIWDDHDYGPNNSDRSFALKGAALRTFKLFWANRTYGTPSLDGVFSRFTWSDAEFFLLDDRYHRSPNKAPQDGKKTMFGRPQLQWLMDSLTDSRAIFKFVVGGNQFLNPRIPYEALGHYPVDRDYILTELHRRKIEGVVFLSGDRHQSELIRRQRPDAYPLYDFTASPLLSGTHSIERERDNPARVPGTLVGVRNFGEMVIAGKKGQRSVILRCLDGSGESLWEHRLPASELRYRK